ncbi:hypothetical protein ABZ214_39235 [Streptomyces iakyrus]|uniref:hypothetical protein n=1 Tax=Streptomyces iakyrus TaxID=68219 RepID=UPI0033B8463A
MTAATNRRTSPRSGAVRWARGALVALLAAFAVLVHHDTSAMPSAAVNSMSAMPAMTAMGAMPGMDHGSGATAAEAARSGDDTAFQATAPATDTDDAAAACAGPAMWHCSAGDLGTAKLAPPPAGSAADTEATAHSVPTGASTGVPHRAPPDLSFLSRLLI